MLTQHFPASHPVPSYANTRPEFHCDFEFGFSLDSPDFIPSGSTSSWQSSMSPGETFATAHHVRPDSYKARAFVCTDCPPVGENEVAPVVTTPAASGPRAGIRPISGLSKKAQRELSALRLLKAGVSFSASPVSTSQTSVLSLGPDVLLRRPGSGICGSCPSTPCVGCKTF